MKKSGADKHFRCTICQRGFTRIDHLKRHHLRHSGLKPYSCVFCDEAFARCDNLRDHYADCVKRGGRSIPETGQRGRRRHACQSCASMKLRCDGESPCASCQKRGLACNNDRRAQMIKHMDCNSSSSSGNNSNNDDDDSRQPTIESPLPCPKREDYEQSSDRGSIKFLLNAGTDSFTEQFHLPPRGDRARGLVYHNQSRFEVEPSSMLPFQMRDDAADFAPTFVDSYPTNLSFFHDTFVHFFNGPFADSHKALEDPYTGGIAYQALIPPGQDPNLALPDDQAEYEPEQPFASGLTQSILTRAWTVPLDNKAQEELSTNLNFLLTTARIRKFAALYFKYWHPSCSIIHPPSFDLDTVALPLLASVVFMGAMYSEDEREAYVAKRVLDFAELYVFSSDTFSCDSEIGATFTSSRAYDEDATDWIRFQNLQAGFLMVPVQYWAGSRVARNRAMENRFSEVVKVARRFGLLKSRHLPEERGNEYLWIQKESKIRLVNIISLMDCAFSFYQNYPCRLTHTEMDCELACEEQVFNLAHPSSSPYFRFCRDLTISEAFQRLFEEDSDDRRDGSFGNGLQQLPDHAINPPSKRNQSMQLTILDMFVLIHLLYAFINTHMTLLVPSMHKNRISKSGLPEDSILAAIRRALTHWRELWVALNNQVPSDEWASMGFYRNAYNFWLVSQLLITKKESVDVVMQMEVKCEDKLEKLKVLLQDESD